MGKDTGWQRNRLLVDKEQELAGIPLGTQFGLGEQEKYPLPDKDKPYALIPAKVSLMSA